MTGLDTTDNNSLAQQGTIGAQLESGANAKLFTVSLASGTSTVGATEAYVGPGSDVSSGAGDSRSRPPRRSTSTTGSAAAPWAWSRRPVRRSGSLTSTAIQRPTSPAVRRCRSPATSR